MNTKKFLLICVFLLASLTVSTSIKYVEKRIAYSNKLAFAYQADINHSVTAMGRHGSSFPTDNPWNINTTDASTDHNPEDHSKSHTIHFERFADRKRRLIFCIMGKVILILSHLCSLLSLFFHN